MKFLAVAALVFSHVAGAADATFWVNVLTPETALKAARAALERCRASGYQVAVAVSDRTGVVQVVLRDRFAGPHTLDLATSKAYTAASFRMSTSELQEATQPGRPQSGIRNRPGEDEACAAAGIATIREELELQ